MGGKGQFFKARLAASKKRAMGLGKKSSVEQNYKACTIDEKTEKRLDNNNITPSASFVDELLRATASIKETKTIHQDIVDDMYLREYEDAMGA
jgi:hypothetical protein